MEKTKGIKMIVSKDRGFRFALPALCLGAFHMIVAYAILAVGEGFEGPGDDFIPGLFEGLIGIVLYGGLALCVISAIIHVKCLYVLDFIGIVAAARFLLPVIGMVGGGIVIAFVIIVILLGVLMYVAGQVAVGVAEALQPIIGIVQSISFVLSFIAEYALPVFGFLMIAGMAISALTGVISGLASFRDIISGILPLL